MFKIKYSKREKKNALFAFALLAFPILQFLVFYLYINLSSITLSFLESDGTVGFGNFVKVWEGFRSSADDGLQMSLFRSMITWAAGIFITFPLSVLFAYALFKKILGEMAFRVIFFLPSILGAVVMTTMYRYIVAADGPLLSMLTAIGIGLPPDILRDGLLGTSSSAFVTILFYGYWLGLGSNIIVLTGALTRIPKEIFESGKLDGVSFMREFFSLTLPLIWPTLSTLLIFQMSGIFTADSGTFLLVGSGGQKGTSTIGFWLFDYLYRLSESNAATRHFGYPAAVGLVLTVVTIPIVLVVRHFLEKGTDDMSY